MAREGEAPQDVGPQWPTWSQWCQRYVWVVWCERRGAEEAGTTQPQGPRAFPFPFVGGLPVCACVPHADVHGFRCTSSEHSRVSLVNIPLCAMVALKALPPHTALH